MEGTPFGRYQLVEVLGRGGMGEVWRAFDTGTERIVAVKVLPAHLAGDDGFQQRFLREAKAAASLNEPHVVPIYDFGQVDGRLFVAMRLVDGHDLQDLLAHGPLSPDRAVTIIEQIASALDAAHRIGLIHRDVKPSNILVAEDDFAYLIDFGIARVAGETGLTSTGMTLGTWPYMAPERFRTGTADARADVYALTCVLHQALTGQQPFPGESLEQIATGHMFDPPPRPSAIQASVPATMDDVIATGMAKDPDQRYATTRDLAQAARTALPAPVGQTTIAAAGAATLAAPTPELNDAPTLHAPTEAARDHNAASPAEQPQGRARGPATVIAAGARERLFALVPARYTPAEAKPVRSTSPTIKVVKERPHRPAAVTAAVVIAGLLVALHAFTGAVFVSEGFSYLRDPDYGSYSTMMFVVGAESMALTAFLVWSAVVALKRAEPRGLIFAPLLAAAFMIVAVFSGLLLGGEMWEASGMLFYPLLLLPLGSFLLTRRSSKAYFQSQSQSRSAT